MIRINFVTAANEISAGWWNAMANMAVQSVWLFVVLIFAIRFINKMAPNHRFWFWQVIAAKFMLLPFAEENT